MTKHWQILTSKTCAFSHRFCARSEHNLEIQQHKSDWITFVFFIVSILNLVFPLNASAETFRIIQQGGAATAQSGAFAAQADDPSAIFYNPAGLTQLSGTQIEMGTNLMNGRTRFKNLDGEYTKGNLDGVIAYPPPSYFYISSHFKALGIEPLHRVAFGLGVFSPFGLRTRYSEAGPLSSAQTFGSLPLIDIKPTFAIQLSEQLSVAFGPDFYTFTNLIAEGESRIQFGNPGIPGLPPDARIEFRGRDTAVGFHLGLLYTALQYPDGHPMLNIALVYKNRASLDLKGELRANKQIVSPAKATLSLPRVYSAGFAFWPIHDTEQQWKLEVDVDYSDWESFNNLDIKLNEQNRLPFPQEWNSSFFVKFGTEYRWFKPSILPSWEIALRGGYGFSETPVPDRTFIPLIADSDFHTLSLGLGLSCRKNGYFLGLIPCGTGIGIFKTESIDLDLSYQTIFLEARNVNGNINPNVNGRYKTLMHVGAISLRIGF